MRNPISLLATIAASVTLASCSVDGSFVQRVFDAEPRDTSGPDPDASATVDLVVSASAMTVSEGGTQQFSVRLSAEPATSVLVTLETSDDTRLAVSPTALLFSPTDWETEQTVTITGRPDSDPADESLEVTLRSTALAMPVTIDVLVDDDDGLALSMTPSPTVDVGEGSTATIDLHLTAMPPGNVTVAIASTNTSVATVSSAMVVFTPANYAIDQTITITGIEDVDTVTSGATINFTSVDLTPTSLVVQVADNDILGITISTSSVSLTEGGSQGFTVALTQQPPSDVSVAVATLDGAVATATPTPLLFTTTTWNTPRTVTVTSTTDDDVENGNTSITLSAPGLATRTVAINVTDDDVQSIITTPVTTLPVTEGASATVAVRLAFRPSSDVMIIATTGAMTVATVAPATLTFTPTNYATTQDLTVSGTQDADTSANNTTLTIEAAALSLSKNITVNVTDNDVVLTVAKAGNGAGTVASAPAGISNCGAPSGADCTEPYTIGTSVTLTPTASTGSTFTGWTGTHASSCTGTAPVCTLSMTAARNVTANFTLTQHAVTVTKAGSGSGTVASSPTGISNCGAPTGSDCTENFNYGTSVTLTPTASTGSTFSGWSGTDAPACTGTAPLCTLSVTQARSVTATFTINQYTVTVTKAGPATGTIASSPVGISNCGAPSGADCTEDYNYGTLVTLTPSAPTGSSFSGWSGTDASACTGTPPACTLAVTQARNVTATFTITQHPLTVTRAGSGTGTVMSNPPGILCAPDCSESYDYNTMVILTASAAGGSTFAGFSGACTTSPCMVTMTQARNVTATFTQDPFCGDGTCNGSENCSSCPGDCGSCSPFCGDGTCNGGETCTSCPGDCGNCGGFCGDSVCEGVEGDMFSPNCCASDCGINCA